MNLSATNISYSVPGKMILRECSLVAQPGRFTVVVGPNGAGKSSLLRIMAHEIKDYDGSVTLNEQNQSLIHHKRLAQCRAVLPQHTSVNSPFTVEQIVEIGRYAHDTTRQINQEIINEVIELTSLAKFRDRIYQTLSGGEQQRVQMARVMSQIWDESDHPKYLLLDEPTASLDIAQQHTLLHHARLLCERNIGVFAILHDLNLATQYGDDIHFLKQGAILAGGAVEKIVTAEIITETFDHPVRVLHDEVTGRPEVYVLPKGTQALQASKSVNNYAYEQHNY